MAMSMANYNFYKANVFAKVILSITSLKKLKLTHSLCLILIAIASRSKLKNLFDSII